MDKLFKVQESHFAQWWAFALGGFKICEAL